MRNILVVLAISVLQGAASSSEINVKAGVGVYEKIALDGTSGLMENMSFSQTEDFSSLVAEYLARRSVIYLK